MTLILDDATIQTLIANGLCNENTLLNLKPTIKVILPTLGAKVLIVAQKTANNQTSYFGLLASPQDIRLSWIHFTAEARVQIIPGFTARTTMHQFYLETRLLQSIPD